MAFSQYDQTGTATLSVLEAILLGIIQGLTEFLPVSSTAHLTLAGKLFNLISPEHPEAWTAYIAVIQLGTLVAVLLYFTKDIKDILHALLRDAKTHGLSGISRYSLNSRLGMYIAFGTLPVVVAGLLLKDLIHGMFTKSILVISVSLIILALLLWLAEKVSRHTRNISELSLKDALVIGCAQALALIPGASRSGTTLTAGLFLGFARPDAARFSFLLSIPAVLASGFYEMTRIDPSVFQYGIMNLVVGTIFAAISGYMAIAWLLKYLSRNSSMVFVWYRIALGVVLAGLVLAGFIQA